jgi:murein DD-endopeptidase MepM/ murein hydrolase activator NlpD
VKPLSAHPIFLQQRLILHFILQNLTWLSGLGVLSGGAVLAQAPNDLTIGEPSAPTVNVTPNAALKVSPAAPEVVAPEASSSAPVQPETSAPTRSLPIPVFAPISGSPSVALPQAAEPDSYDEPAAIVITERSSGCRSVVELGQGVESGPCGAPEPPPAPVSAVSTASSSSPISPSSVPSTVQLGGLTINAAGMSLSTTPLTPGTTAASRDYYNRTVRPPDRLGNSNIKLIFPLSLPAAISSAFGWRIHPITGGQRFHAGTDLAAPLGTPVLAAFAGKVALADFFGGYGLTVALDHNKSTQQTLYAHLSEIFVKPGQWVKQGDVIGRVGSTGNSTGPHLHFEFRQLTLDGWVAMDAGQQLEYALAQLVKVLQQTAQVPQPPARSIPPTSRAENSSDPS